MPSRKQVSELKKMNCKVCVLHIQDALCVLSGKWKIPIITSLWYGNKRFTEIRREIPAITDRMLSKELRELEANKLVTRTVYDALPVVVEYALTDYGRSIDTVIAALSTWGAQHREMLSRS